MLWLCAFLGLFYGSKPSLTIAPAFWENHWKTINVNGQSGKNIQWWCSGCSKTIEKPLKAMVLREKNIPMFGENDHRRSLSHTFCWSSFLIDYSWNKKNSKVWYFVWACVSWVESGWDEVMTLPILFAESYNVNSHVCSKQHTQFSK